MNGIEYKPIAQLEDGVISPESRTPRWRFSLWAKAYMLVLHALVVLLIFRLSFGPELDARCALQQQRSWSPVHDHLEYELNKEHSVNHSMHSEYSGYPTQEKDEAWMRLMKPMFFNVSLEELRRSGESLDGVAEVEEGGYSATLGVYHELHCLRQLRFYLFREIYYPDLTRKQEIYLFDHLDHCIETLRLRVMCHGNTGLYSFAWADADAPKAETQSSSSAVCVKWSSIDNWAKSRTPGKLHFIGNPWVRD